MAASPWLVHNSALAKIVSSDVDIVNDNFTVRLYNSDSNVHNAALSDATTATGELSGSGYDVGGAPTVLSVSENAGVVTVQGTDVSWTADGGNLTTAYAAIVDITTVPPEVVATTALNVGAGSITVYDGNPLNINFNVNGAFTFSRVV